MTIENNFWLAYDEYIATSNKNLKQALLEYLAEHQDIKLLTRPELNWNHILAWEVLRPHTFYFPRAVIPFQVFEGELIVVEEGWDRDVLFTREPRQELISGPLMRLDAVEERIFLPLFDATVVRNKTLAYSQLTLKEQLEFLDEQEKYWKQLP